MCARNDCRNSYIELYADLVKSRLKLPIKPLDTDSGWHYKKERNDFQIDLELATKTHDETRLEKWKKNQAKIHRRENRLQSNTCVAVVVYRNFAIGRDLKQKEKDCGKETHYATAIRRAANERREMLNNRIK